MLVSPLLALQFGMTPEAFGVLMATLLLGTPVLSLLGGVGAALTLGLRSAGVLVLLLVLPLCVSVLVFGAGAVSAVDAGLSPQGHLSLLAALLLLTAAGAPWPSSAARFETCLFASRRRVEALFPLAFFVVSLLSAR